MEKLSEKECKGRPIDLEIQLDDETEEQGQPKVRCLREDPRREQECARR